MILRSLVLYNADGRQISVPFNPGLNVITGNSGSGKSALLDMVEYCLGRDRLVMPVGPITQTVAWYGLLVDFGDQRAFIGRPAPKPGKARSSQAMLEFGSELEAPSFDHLVVNADTTEVRSQIGRAIGIDENQTNPEGVRQQGYEANLGHALLLCLQRQSEIANREFLFHRQGEDGISAALRATIPYFLGAVAKDRAILRQQLLAARRALRAAEVELQRAEAADENTDVAVRALVGEAEAVGLLTGDTPIGTADSIAALRGVVSTPLQDSYLDDEEADRRTQLVRRREDLREELRQAGVERSTLEAMGVDEENYEGVVAQQASRLRSLELLSHENKDTGQCPLCGVGLLEPDPTITDLQVAAQEIQQQTGVFGAAVPRRRQALAQVGERVDRIRNDLRTTDRTLQALDSAQQTFDAGQRFAERQAFLQGRVQHFLETVDTTQSGALALLRERAETRMAAVERLESQLDADDEREQLISRLAIVGRDMTTWADRLGLEHSGISVRLDMANLTVVADTATGPAALNQIGAGENWIGYHLVTHLALHKFFIEQNRPVPRLLMLDQPTQVYYPSDVDREQGVPEADADRLAVQRMFELINDVVNELDNELQVIVCDHAYLPDSWFRRAIAKNWRNGERLIPADWLD